MDYAKHTMGCWIIQANWILMMRLAAPIESLLTGKRGICSDDACSTVTTLTTGGEYPRRNPDLWSPAQITDSSTWFAAETPTHSKTLTIEERPAFSAMSLSMFPQNGNPHA